MNNELFTSAIESYFALKARVGQQVQYLLDIHGSHITCCAKCSDCCVNLSVFPVEYYAIKHELSDKLAELTFDANTSCGYLKGDLCVLYASRPLICRTHGVPIVFLADELDPPSYAVDFCPKNFTGQQGEAVEFTPDNILNIDEMNEELYEINQRFIAAFESEEITALTRLPLADLVK